MIKMIKMIKMKMIKNDNKREYRRRIQDKKNENMESISQSQSQTIE